MLYMILAGIICTVTLVLVFQFIDEIVENEVIAGHVKAFVILVMFVFFNLCLAGA